MVIATNFAVKKEQMQRVMMTSEHRLLEPISHLGLSMVGLMVPQDTTIRICSCCDQLTGRRNTFAKRPIFERDRYQNHKRRPAERQLKSSTTMPLALDPRS